MPKNWLQPTSFRSQVISLDTENSGDSSSGYSSKITESAKFETGSYA